MPRRLDRAGAIRSWGPYVRRIADLMCLRDWFIQLIWEGPDEPEVAADIKCIPGRRLAYIRLGDSFLDDYTPDQQRHTVVHELVHAHLDQAQKVAEEAMGEQWAVFRLLLEYGVDAIADGWAPCLPLPDHVHPQSDRKVTTVAKKKAKKVKTGGPMSPGTSKKPKGVDKPARGNQPIAGKKGKMKGDCGEC